MNGILVHGLDFDDTHPGAITHPSASAFPLALGLAAQRHATGAEMITAYVLAIEVVARLRTAARGVFHDVGFYPTALVNAFSTTLPCHSSRCRVIVAPQLGQRPQRMGHSAAMRARRTAGNDG